MTILYDRTGKRYRKGAGLRILIDGVEVASSAKIQRLTVPFVSHKPPPPPESRAPQKLTVFPDDWAMNLASK